MIVLGQNYRWVVAYLIQDFPGEELVYGAIRLPIPAVKHRFGVGVVA